LQSGKCKHIDRSYWIRVIQRRWRTRLRFYDQLREHDPVHWESRVECLGHQLGMKSARGADRSGHDRGSPDTVPNEKLPPQRSRKPLREIVHYLNLLAWHSRIRRAHAPSGRVMRIRFRDNPLSHESARVLKRSVDHSTSTRLDGLQRRSISSESFALIVPAIRIMDMLSVPREKCGRTFSAVDEMRLSSAGHGMCGDKYNASPRGAARRWSYFRGNPWKAPRTIRSRGFLTNG